MSPQTCAALLLLAFVLPVLYARSPGPLAVALTVVSAYFLGVSNERAFPGDHAAPLPGEGNYWLALAALVFVAGVLARPAK